MTLLSLRIDEDEFESQYPLIENHLNPNASWTYGDARGYLFETFGEELEFVRNQNPRCIWTLLDTDGDEVLASGYHHVNRIGYLISTVPVPENVVIEVRLLY